MEGVNIDVWNHFTAITVRAILATCLILIRRHAQVFCYFNALAHLNSKFVLDINECSSNNGGCSQLCINTVGSYYCNCISGFTLSSNYHTCIGESIERLLCLEVFYFIQNRSE